MLFYCQRICHLILVVVALLGMPLSALAQDGPVLYHRVEPGETLSGIAKKYGTTVENLVSLNGIADPHALPAAMVLVVGLEPAFHTVATGENLWAIAHEYGVTVDSILLFNDLPNPDRIVPGQVLTIPPAGGAEALAQAVMGQPRATRNVRWPLEGGVITSLFGPRQDRIHKGLDIAAATGTVVRASGAGVVSYADWAGTYGILVTIDHGDGLITRYAHNSSLLVKPGQRVEAGTPIAKVGSTGRSTGPHVHFEVEINGQVIDPLTVLPPRVGGPY